MTISEREHIQATIATLEEAHAATTGHGKSTYSQGRALPSSANLIQSAIMQLNALLKADEESTIHITTLVSGNEAGEVSAKEVAQTISKELAKAATKTGAK